MRFKEWLIKEVGTSTGDVAGFKRISIPMVRRTWAKDIAYQMDLKPQDYEWSNKPSKPKKPHWQPQVQE